MVHKKKDEQMTFADLEMNISKTFRNNRLEFFTDIEGIIDWEPVEALLNSSYPVGQSDTGAPCYPPLLLLKCTLLQKWFNIQSDPELESQINDSYAFRKFLELGSAQASPDHSTFSLFRKRLKHANFVQLNHNVLNQLAAKGVQINAGAAIDARIVLSASKPLSQKKLKRVIEERSTPEGQMDKTGKLRKFSRDLESNWTIKNDKPYFGMKEHSSVDTDHGFILSTILSPASVHDTNYFQFSTIYSRYTDTPLEMVYADKGYHGAPNREFLSLNQFGDGIMRKDVTNAKLTDLELERNKAISKVRYIVEQYFGISHLHDSGKRARFTTIAKNNVDIWIRQLAFNLRKGMKILRELEESKQAVPAV